MIDVHKTSAQAKWVLSDDSKKTAHEGDNQRTRYYDLKAEIKECLEYHRSNFEATQRI